MDNGNYIFIISGVPGSGKSTLAEKLQANSHGLISPIMDICEADDFFYIVGYGEYQFNPKLLGKAHNWCQNRVKKLMEQNQNLIVSNTNIRPTDRKVYFDLAKEHDYQVVFIHLVTQFQNIHDVPEDVVQRMKDNYIDLTEQERSEVLWKSKMSNELITLLNNCGVDYQY